MVHSVLAVPSVGKVKREFRNMPDEQHNETEKNSSFSSILKEKLNEQKSAPRTCHTVTYGNDCMLHMFQYQTREYHY